MEIEQYVVYPIDSLALKADGSPDYQGPRTRLYRRDLPRWQWKARSRTLEWIYARFVYFNPHAVLQTGLSFYDHKTGIDVGFRSAFSRLTSAKGQVTRVEKAMAEYVNGFRPTLFIKTAEETDAYKKAARKLEEKRELLREAELEVEAEQLKITQHANHQPR